MVTKKPEILVVEDEADVRELILLHLQRDGYAPDFAIDGEEAIQKIQAKTYDLFILDWMLPRMNGLEIIRAIRSKIENKTPILMVTARVETPDIVLGLEAGADDYLTKPFEVPIFLARVRALLRRSNYSNAQQDVERIRIEGLDIDLAAHEVRCEGQLVQLTHSEFKLLVSLAQNQGRVLTRDQLIDLVRGVDVSIVSRAIDTHVFGLRKKLGPCSEVIETIRGIGYRIKAST
ncbi:MAG: response regulator transcription factor [Oligoflexia bacterium]|nr:response regulator transcription factor [Oligoflexia bacterium]